MITSTSNSRIKRLVQLQEKSRLREKENVFIAEGMKMFEEAPMERIKEIYIEDSGGRGAADKLKTCEKKGIPVELVSAEVFKKISDTKSPQGILCVMERYSYSGQLIIEKALGRQRKENRRPLFLFLEDIQNPGNLGTMLRTAEGAGADGVFMTRETVDIYNPKTIRATMGSLYRVPFYYTGDIRESIRTLQKNNIRVYAAHLKGKQYYDEISYDTGTAFLIGNEGNGLKKETADMADCYLKIPMAGKLESLNAAVAAALLMYQAGGQSRRQDES